MKIYLSPSNQFRNTWGESGDQKVQLNTNEADQMQAFSLILKEYLEAAWHEIYGCDNTVGEGNSKLELYESRAIDSNNNGVDLHIALHSNATITSQPGPKGIYSEHTNITQSKELTELILNSLYDEYVAYGAETDIRPIKNSKQVDKYGKPMYDFHELTGGVNAITAYVEVAFHQDEYDIAWMQSNWHSIAKAIADGIISYTYGKRDDEGDLVTENGKVVIDIDKMGAGTYQEYNDYAEGAPIRDVCEQIGTFDGFIFYVSNEDGQIYVDDGKKIMSYPEYIIELVKTDPDKISEVIEAFDNFKKTPEGEEFIEDRINQADERDGTSSAEDSYITEPTYKSGIHEETFEPVIKNQIRDSHHIYMNAAIARPPADPLVFDLTGNGFDITTKENGANFDLSSNGFAEKINWTSSNGILCIDLNNNEKIDNGRELFGDSTLLENGTTALNGFEALAQYDLNEDGVIDENDEVFSKLRIWIDATGDGVTNSGELKTLGELGIIAISLGQETVNIDTGTDATIRHLGSFVWADGTTGTFGDLWVNSDHFDTVEQIDVVIPEEIAELMNVRSIGNVHSLHTAMTLDDTGELKALVESFAAEQDYTARMGIIQQILYFITDANVVASNSRGGNIDAKKLAVLEAMMGEAFVGVSGKNPNAQAASLLNTAYNDIANLYYNELMAQSHLKEYVYLLGTTENSNGSLKLDSSLLEMLLTYQLENESAGMDLLKEVSRYIKYLDDAGIKGFADFVARYVPVSDEYVKAIVSVSGMLTVDSLGNTTVVDGNRLIFIGGENDNNSIKGLSGDDVFVSGKGNDILEGRQGNDTYIFNIGDGADTINEGGYISADRIIFSKGINPEDIVIKRVKDNLVLSVKGTNDSITVQNYFYHDAYKIESYEFADGTVWKTTDITDKSRTYYGTNETTLTGFDSGIGYNPTFTVKEEKRKRKARQLEEKKEKAKGY